MAVTGCRGYTDVVNACRITFPTCRAHCPGGSKRVHVSIASPLTRPSPFCRRVGIRTSTFEMLWGSGDDSETVAAVIRRTKMPQPIALATTRSGIPK
jgi:hypothetical protein